MIKRVAQKWAACFFMGVCIMKKKVLSFFEYYLVALFAYVATFIIGFTLDAKNILPSVGGLYSITLISSIMSFIGVLSFGNVET